jgi:integrase/recombinase XerD
MAMKRGSLKLLDVPPYQALLDAVSRAWKDTQKGRYMLRDLALVSILVFTGCRLGEAMRISKSDLDFKGRAVRIYQLKKRESFIRVVPVPSNLFWEVVRGYTERIAGERLFKFTIRQGRNIVYGFSERYLGRRIRPHAIRHSYAIAVLKATKNLEAVRRLLGHRDYTTIKTYLDMTQEDLEEELSKLFRGL